MLSDDFEIIDGVVKDYSGPGGDIVIPNKVTEIDGMAFYNNTDITSVIIPGEVKKIGQGAFFNCSSLKTLLLGKGVEVIETFAFRGCPLLKSVVIPESVRDIQSMAFDDDTELVRKTDINAAAVPEGDKGTEMLYDLEKIDAGWNIVRYKGQASDVVIPETYRGEKVVSIGYTAFAGEKKTKNDGDDVFLPNEKIISVSIPSSVRFIGAKAFCFCTKLEKIHFEEGLERIGNSAFIGCESLTSVELPHSCREIDTAAFMFCRGIKEMILNDGLETVGAHSLDTDSSEKTALREITFPSTVVNVSADACSPYTEVHYAPGAVNDSRTEELFEMKKTDGGWSIAKYIGSESDVVIPGFYKGEKIVSIGEKAFEKDSGRSGNADGSGEGSKADIGIVSVRIPSTVRIIESNAFASCNTLKEVHFSEGLEKIGEAAFIACDGLTSIELPSSCVEVDVVAFLFCRNISRITLNEGLKKIGQNAFFTDGSKSVALKEVYLPSTVTDVSQNAFPIFTKVNFAQGIANDLLTEKLFRMKKTDGGWCIEKYIGSEADVVIPETYHKEKVVSIGDNAFAVKSDGGTYAIEMNETLRSVSIPSSVREIGSRAFAGCALMNKVSFENGLERIGNDAFFSCKSLTSVEIPASCREIEDRAFFSCEALSRIILNEGLKKVGEKAFYTDDSPTPALKSILFPSTLSSVPQNSYPPSTKVQFMWSVEEIPQFIEMYIEQNRLADNRCFHPAHIDSLRSFANVPPDEETLLAYDTTYFHDGKRGWVWTKRGFYVREEPDKCKFMSWYEFLVNSNNISYSTDNDNRIFIIGNNYQFSFFAGDNQTFGIVYNALRNLLSVLRSNVYLGEK